MQKWLQISLLLCTFGFFREMRPSEPFVAEYLTGEWRNLTSEQVNQEVYPFGTYFVLAQLVIVFLVTDILRYKPIIVVSAVAGIILFAVLLWTKTILALQIGQVFYGTFMASEVAYYTYIYAKVDREQYQVVTGHTRSAILAGKFLAGVLAQVLISSDAMDYKGLHYISFGTQVVSLFIALALPRVERSLYFYSSSSDDSTTQGDTKGAALDASNVLELARKGDTELNITGTAPSTNGLSAVTLTDSNTEPKFSWKNASRLLVQHFVNAYTNPTVVQWSLWWALATCGQLQVISYVQFLWKDIDANSESHYNGAVEATVTLLGAIGAMIAGMMNSAQRQHRHWHVWVLTISTLLMGAFIIISSVTNLVWVAYTMYVLFGTFYFFVITIATAIVASNLSDDSFGLIFGINTLVALVLQTILTLVVVTDTGYGLDPRSQYMVYGIYFIVLALLYCFVVLLFYLCGCRNVQASFDVTTNDLQSNH